MPDSPTRRYGVRGDPSIELPDVLVANCGGAETMALFKDQRVPGFVGVTMSVMQELQRGAHLLPPHRAWYVSLSSLSAAICNDTYSLRPVLMCRYVDIYSYWDPELDW
jgi:hypothetical protein